MADIKSIISRLRESVENSGFSYVELEKRTGIAKSSIRGSLETVDTQRLQGFSFGDPSEIRTPDTLIKSQICSTYI